MLRNFLQPAAPQLSLSAVDELYQELGEPDEFASGAEASFETQDSLLHSVADPVHVKVESLLAADEARGWRRAFCACVRVWPSCMQELARGLASTVLLYRDLTGLSGSMTPAMQACTPSELHRPYGKVARLTGWLRTLLAQL